MSGTSINFNELFTRLQTVVGNVQNYLRQLRESGGNVDLGVMFNMQFQMQMMSQFIEAASSTLTAVHGQMVSMAKAIKGQ